MGGNSYCPFWDLRYSAGHSLQEGVIVFELTIGGSQYFATDEDLRSMGYRVNSLSDDRASIIDSKGRTLDMFFNLGQLQHPLIMTKNVINVITQEPAKAMRQGMRGTRT